MDSLGAVSVQRLWPNKIDIHVEQREPSALWQDGLNSGDWRVIDQRGRTFAEADPARYMHLPRVVGEDAAEAAATLVTAIKEFPNLADRMDVAYRVGGRRWDVKFKGRTDVVAFPDDARLMEQLDALNLMQAQNRVLDLPATRIDARHPKYIALQPMPGAPADASSPGGT
jgi:cell division protein FtsQ